MCSDYPACHGEGMKDCVMVRVSGCFSISSGFPPLGGASSAFKTSALNKSLPECLVTSDSACPIMFHENSLYFFFTNFVISYVSTILWIIYSPSQYSHVFLDAGHVYSHHHTIVHSSCSIFQVSRFHSL